MKIKLLRNTVVNGEARLAGEIVDNVSESDARLLVGIKKAEYVEEIKTNIETADAEPVNIETTAKPAPRKKKDQS